MCAASLKISWESAATSQSVDRETLKISNLRPMLWVALELWVSAVITLNSGFQLSWDTSAGWEKREPTGEEHQVHVCSMQSTNGRHLNWVFICIVNCVVPAQEEQEGEVCSRESAAQR